jgi:hypothetical protein
MRGKAVFAPTLRSVTLGVLLAAGLASAQTPKKKKEAAPQPPKPLVTKAPKTCADQCEIIDKVCAEPCKDIKGNPDAKRACEANCKQMADACNGSCKSKGKMDAQYMMENIKPPKAPPGVKVKNDDDH